MRELAEDEIAELGGPLAWSSETTNGMCSWEGKTWRIHSPAWPHGFEVAGDASTYGMRFPWKNYRPVYRLEGADRAQPYIRVFAPKKEP